MLRGVEHGIKTLAVADCLFFTPKLKCTILQKSAKKKFCHTPFGFNHCISGQMYQPEK